MHRAYNFSGKSVAITGASRGLWSMNVDYFRCGDFASLWKVSTRQMQQLR